VEYYCKWSESRISDRDAWESDILMDHNIQYVSISRRGLMNRTLWHCDFEFIDIKQLQQFLARRVWNCTIPKRVFSIQITWQNLFIH
jgi:hypothetical protein